MWWLPLCAAWADDDVIAIPPAEELPSVVVALEEASAPLVRHRFGARPILSVAMATDAPLAPAARLGAGLLHHWWTVSPGAKVTWSGETSLSASGVVGDLGGWEVEAMHLAGPWFGPVGLRLGPTLRGDTLGRMDGTAVLSEAFLVGFRGVVTVDPGPVVIWAGAGPAWPVVGARVGSALPSNPELDVVGGLTGRVRMGLLRPQIGVGTRARWTAIGPVVEVHLVLHLSVEPPL